MPGLMDGPGCQPFDFSLPLKGETIMRLYTRNDASSVTSEDHGTFDVDPETGSVEVPEALGKVLHGQHINGKAAWEDETERFHRLAAEDLARRQDPATLLAAVEALRNPQPAEPDPRVAQLEAEVAELKQLLEAATKLVEPEAPAAEPEPEPGVELPLDAADGSKK